MPETTDPSDPTELPDALDTSEDAEEPEPLDGPRPSARRTFAVAFVIGLVAAVLLGVGALYAYDRQFTGPILPGVHVGTVDRSGLDADEARSALESAYGSLSDGRLVLTAVPGEQIVTYAEIGRGPDIDAMLDEAIAVGRDGSPVDRVVADAR